MRVLVTGAAGSIGRVVCRGLARAGHTVAGLDLLQRPADGPAQWFVADCADPAAVRDVFERLAESGGTDAVVHLAGIPTEASLPASLHSHVVTTGVLLDAMLAHGVWRILYASSNHAVGRCDRVPLLGVDVPARPDTFYGVGKVAAETLLRLYVERHGLDAVAARIGSFLERPETRRHLSTWLSHDDSVRLVEAALTCPSPGFRVVYGISANTRAWWDLAPGHAIGYRPQDDAERFAAEIEQIPPTAVDEVEAARVGGSFATEAFHRPAVDLTEAVDPGLLPRARAWAAEDPDEETRAELVALVARVSAGDDPAAVEELADRFAGRLEFGTAGLRGALGAGPNRMNRVVVVRAAAGLAAYLRAGSAAADEPPAVVIGYDARHKSDVFARDTAAVMEGAGLRALLLPRPLPTPVLAFAIRRLGCVAGVMVTASHNPPQDNGYKVYLGNGSQIVPPADAEISAAIDRVGPLADVPMREGAVVLGEELLDEYVAAVAGLAAASGARDLASVYTPLHGVGGSTVQRVLEAAGFPRPAEVADQAEPDPDFPTVTFPNPEEPGAMDRALALAASVDADLVLANDPDADRCAVAVPDAVGAAHPGGWRMLSGDEVGVVLADYLLRRGVAGVYATTIVSSSLLGKLAAAAGRSYRETLTGFKWLCRVEGLAFAYEEALGYCVAPGMVRDKDGISALLLVAVLAAELKEQGRTLTDRLDDLAREHGVHATDQLSMRVSDRRQIAEAMSRLRSDPPASLGGLPVRQVDDLTAGSGDLPPTEGLRFRLAEDARVVVRPSGTEPKLKCYLEVVVPVSGAGSDAVAAARSAAADRLGAVRTDLSAALCP